MTEGSAHSAGPSVAVIIVAAGSGSRLGAGRPKAAVELEGVSLLTHAVRGALEALPGARLIVVVPAGDARVRQAFIQDLEKEQLPEEPDIVWVEGGAERSDSVRAGLEHVQERYVLIHDCARALTPASLFRAVYSQLVQGALAAIPALPVVDTIKMLTEDESRIAGTPPRQLLRAVQTPQGFLTEQLRKVHRIAADSAQADASTDDAMLMEQAGIDVRLVQGHPRALKITGPLDLVQARYLIRHPQELS